MGLVLLIKWIVGYRVFKSGRERGFEIVLLGRGGDGMGWNMQDLYVRARRIWRVTVDFRSLVPRPLDTGRILCRSSY